MLNRCTALILLVFLLLFFPQSIKAQYAASGVIGQTDQAGDPDFTTSSITGRTAINGWGFGGATYTLIDTTRNYFFVSDPENHRVLVWNLTGSDAIPYTEEADYVLGQANFTSNSTHSRGQNTLTVPQQLALDNTRGLLFVSDGNRVLVFDISAGISNNMNASYVLGQANYSANVTTIAQNVLGPVNGVAFDPADNFLYISQGTGANRVSVYNTTSLSNGMNAVNVLGQGNHSTSASGTTQSTLNDPGGVSVDSSGNRLFVGDTQNHRVIVYDITALSNGENASAVLGQTLYTTNSAATTQGGLAYPGFVSYDADDNHLYVSELMGYLPAGSGLSNNERVTIFDVNGITNGENAINVLGKSDFITGNPSGSTVTATPSVFTSLLSATYLGNNLLAVGNYGRVTFFDVTSITNGEAATTALGVTDFDGNIRMNRQGSITINNQVPRLYSLDRPSAVAIDTTNNKAYISSWAQRRVLVYDLDPITKELVDLVPEYVLGQSDFGIYLDTEVTQSKFKPYDLAIDPENQRLFVADGDNYRVLVFDVSTISNGEPAEYVLFQEDFTHDDSGTSSTRTEGPYRVEYNAEDEWLFVADPYNARILLLDLSSGITNDMPAAKVIGQDDFDSSNFDAIGPGTFDDIDYGDLVFDPVTDRLYVADSGFARVLVFQLPEDLSSVTNGLDASNVIGQSDFVTSDTSTISNDVTTYPHQLAVNDSTLYVSDLERVLLFDVTEITDGEAAYAVLGQEDFTSTDTGTTQSLFDFGDLSSLAVDTESNRLYMGEMNNNRVLWFDFIKIVEESLTTPTLNQSYSQTITSTQDTGSVSYSLSSGALPTGVSLGSNVITGTPQSAGSFSFSLKALDTQIGNYGSFYDLRTYSWDITAGGSSNSNSSQNQHRETQCTATPPQGNVDLFQAQTKSNSITISFAPVLSANKYFVEYYAPGNPTHHGVMFDQADNSGVIQYEIKDLVPNTKYNFKVVPFRDCAAGPGQDTIDIKTSKSKTKGNIFYNYINAIKNSF